MSYMKVCQWFSNVYNKRFTLILTKFTSQTVNN